jgi:dephospho-CoA kinase
MKVIGITGGIGSGKSTILNILKDTYNAFVISTDHIDHKLMEKGNISYNLIVENFGSGILDQEGNINRKKLGAIVYNNPEKLLLLNSLSHPYVMKHVIDIIEEKRKEKVALICVETALPKEAGLSNFCDEIWYIHASENIRRERLQKSRNYTNEKIDTIFYNQIKENEYRKISTHIIDNNLSREKVAEQIAQILKNIPGK